MEMLQVFSYAKINLGLLLLGKRTDGYHDIATLFQLIDLHDTLHFEKSDHLCSIEVQGIKIPTDQNNLIHKAVTLMQQQFSIEGGVHVHVEKQIPVGGGLGGGSSNAAMTLIALNQLFQLSLDEKILHALGMQIGSDVPFFLKGKTSLGLGRGEELEPFEIPSDYWLVLLLPEISVSTAWAYQHARIGLTSERKLAKFRALLGNFDYCALKGNLVNELERVVFKRHPQLQQLKMQLYEKDAFYASMSGSGSTMYGLFTSSWQAQEAVSFFSKKGVRALVSCPMVHSPGFEAFSIQERGNQ